MADLAVVRRCPTPETVTNLQKIGSSSFPRILTDALTLFAEAA
jgi:hypothetical protein